MKKIKGMVFATIIITLLLTASIPVFAFSENESRSVKNFFIEAELLKGNGSSYGLEKAPTRMEGIIILIRLLGKETEALQMESLPCQFTDVPAWAKGYANYAYAENISKGISGTLFGTNNKMTAQQYNTLLLRTIGYNDSQGDFLWSAAVEKAYDLDILPVDLAVQYEKITNYTKGDLIDTSFCFLEAEYKGEERTLIDQLIASGVIADELANDYGLAVKQWDSITTNNGENNYSSFELDGDTLSITGATDNKNRKWILAQVKNTATGTKVADTVQPVGDDGKYNLKLLLESVPKGEYYIDVYSNSEKYNYYTSFILSSVTLKITRDEIYLDPSPVYGQNLRFYKGNQVDEQDKVMILSTRSSEQGMIEVSDLAAEITKGCSNDYDKIQAIHDWVAENLYYDQDYFNGKTKTTNIDTLSVLKNRYAVCSGYSNLVKDLIAASGIPCKQVVGFALGISTEGDWEDAGDLDTISPNHVWNEAYVDGRWIIMDATWDSSNKYEGGVFTTGKGVSQLYFDVTTEFLSNTHMSSDYRM